MEKEEEEGKQPTNNLNLLQTETHSNFFTSCFEFQDNKQPFENMASPHPIDRSLLNCTDAKTITAFLATLSLGAYVFVMHRQELSSPWKEGKLTRSKGVSGDKGWQLTFEDGDGDECFEDDDTTSPSRDDMWHGGNKGFYRFSTMNTMSKAATLTPSTDDSATLTPSPDDTDEKASSEPKKVLDGAFEEATTGNITCSRYFLGQKFGEFQTQREGTKDEPTLVTIFLSYSKKNRNKGANSPSPSSKIVANSTVLVGNDPDKLKLASLLFFGAIEGSTFPRDHVAFVAFPGDQKVHMVKHFSEFITVPKGMVKPCHTEQELAVLSTHFITEPTWSELSFHSPTTAQAGAVPLVTPSPNNTLPEQRQTPAVRALRPRSKLRKTAKAGSSYSNSNSSSEKKCSTPAAKKVPEKNRQKKKPRTAPHQPDNFVQPPPAEMDPLSVQKTLQQHTDLLKELVNKLQQREPQQQAHQPAVQMMIPPLPQQQAHQPAAPMMMPPSPPTMWGGYMNGYYHAAMLPYPSPAVFPNAQQPPPSALNIYIHGGGSMN